MKESKKGFIVTNSKNEVIGFMESYDLIEGKTYKNFNLYRYYITRLELFKVEV